MGANPHEAERQCDLTTSQHRHISSAQGKENAVVHAPSINPRSKNMVGKREGDACERLHEESREREARRRAAINEAESRLAAEAEDEARNAVPEINNVSAQLAAARTGDVTSRLFEYAKESARKHEEKAKDAEREAAAARPMCPRVRWITACRT